MMGEGKRLVRDRHPSEPVPDAARRAYCHYVEGSTAIFWGLIRNYYLHSFRELFMNGRGPFQVHNAVISILAGQVFPRPVWKLRWRLWFFNLCVRLQQFLPLVPRRAEFSLLGEPPVELTVMRRSRRRPHEGSPFAHALDGPSGKIGASRGRASESPAFRVPGAGSLSYEQLAGAVAGFGNLLRSEMTPGAVIMLSCPSRLEYPVAFLAALAAGCTVFPVSSDAADAEKSNAARIGHGCVIGDERSVQLLGPILKRAIHVRQALSVSAGGSEFGGACLGRFIIAKLRHHGFAENRPTFGALARCPKRWRLPSRWASGPTIAC